MPTYEATPRFTTDLDRLTPEQRRRFRQAVHAVVDDLRTGRFRARLSETSGRASYSTADSRSFAAGAP
ncbi:hypothetical protein AB0E25_40950 [Streptomyces bobili]|uniref:hypothetical protein n=1 Tax=Streptomyces bobili TaxID=67280 RepID=UPI0033F308E2